MINETATSECLHLPVNILSGFLSAKNISDYRSCYFIIQRVVCGLGGGFTVMKACRYRSQLSDFFYP